MDIQECPIPYSDTQKQSSAVVTFGSKKARKDLPEEIFLEPRLEE